MRVEITTDPRLLYVLRGGVRCRAVEVGFSPADADCLAMAIDEAAANVIQHAYGNRHDARLTVEILGFPDRIEFVLEDTGLKVQPDTIRPRPLDELRPGGLGTYFIQCFMDSSAYDENFPEGNRLRLVKYLPREVSPRDEDPSEKRR